MSYSCRLYKNTGFNATNIPDSINLLNQCQNFTVPALEILQERNLNSIKVKATWDQVKDVDYCILNNNWVYAVVNCTMENTDTANLAVIPDYINSTGGVGALNILDGITERVHVNDDSYGKYDEDDPLMTPVKPLKLLLNWKSPSNKCVTCIESTLSPGRTAKTHIANNYDVENIENGTVIVPQSQPIPKETKFNGSFKRGTALYVTAADSGTGISTNDEIKKHIANLRSLGLEQAIINQVKYPIDYVDITAQGDSIYNDMIVESINGKTGNWDSNINFIQHSTAKNNRINYANIEYFGLISTTGESCQYEPATLYNNSSTPKIIWKADANPDGKPYFRFSVVNGNSEFWRNCISGMEWKNVPLTFYTGKSGNALDTLKFNNQQYVNSEMNQMSKVQDFINGTSAAIKLGMDMNAASSSKGAGAGDMINDLMGIGTSFYNMHQKDKSLELQRRGELLDFDISQNIVVPTVNFPFNSEYIRDLQGNGVMVYRYVLDDFDVARIDKLLTMYGYKHTKALETSDFTNRLYFNFVMAKDISVTGHAAWINDGIADQLKAGVRVWHVLPNKSYYTNNPIR